MCACDPNRGITCPTHTTTATINSAATWECGSDAGVTLTNRNNLFTPRAIKVNMTSAEMISLATDLLDLARRHK